MRYADIIPKEIIVNEDLKLRAMDDGDKADYIELSRVTSPDIDSYNAESYNNIMWEAVEAMGVFEYVIERSGIFVGAIMLKDYEEAVELGCDIMPDCQNQGFCQKGLAAVIDMLKTKLPDVQIVFRAETQNMVSMHIIKKLGGVLLKCEADDLLERFGIKVAEDHKIMVYSL